MNFAVLVLCRRGPATHRFCCCCMAWPGLAWPAHHVQGKLARLTSKKQQQHVEHCQHRMEVGGWAAWARRGGPAVALPSGMPCHHWALFMGGYGGLLLG